MRAIVAVDQNWAIGRDGDMLYHLPSDLKFFAKTTRGGTLVMGRATLESLPGGKPLKGRRNLVLSRRPGYQVEGAQVLSAYAQLEDTLRGTAPDQVFLIGGARVYEDLIDCCDLAFVTRIEASAPADRFFPDLDKRTGWLLLERSEAMEENGLRYTICLYRNTAVQPIPQDS